MDKHRKLARVAAIALAAVVAWGVVPVRAEVSAEVDPSGNYMRTVVLVNASLKNVKIWSVQRSQRNLLPLNREGDRSGDLWPTIVENPADANHPWVVWSRFAGEDYDLVWSRWLPSGWTGALPVGQPRVAGDDLDPAMTFDSFERPVVAWWRNVAGTGRVYVSVFKAGAWGTELAVSDTTVDSRYPEISRMEDGNLLIVFDTPSGQAYRVIGFAAPGTITEDLNPFGSLSVLGGGSGGAEQFGS